MLMLKHTTINKHTAKAVCVFVFFQRNKTSCVNCENNEHNSGEQKYYCIQFKEFDTICVNYKVMDTIVHPQTEVWGVFVIRKTETDTQFLLQLDNKLMKGLNKLLICLNKCGICIKRPILKY